MSIISLMENNCKHCHHCVAHCPTNAIAFINNQPEIISDDCILCGECFVVCPQHAKSVASDVEQVLQWIKNGEQVHASLAPSFVAMLESEKSIKDRLLAMGFATVSETSIAAARVSDYYRELCKTSTNNVISTCCPVVVSLIEKEFPQLIDQLAPIQSPMLVHGQMLKQQYPNDKVVFIGPCIAKIQEAYENEYVDGVLTFEDIMGEIEDNIKDQPFFHSTFENDKARAYPASGGILSTLNGLEKDVDTMVVDGIESVKDCCQAICDHQINNVFIEMSACVGSCLNGPMLQDQTRKKWKAKQIVESYSKNKLWKKQPLLDSIHATYTAQNKKQPIFSEAQIQEVLASLGKYSKEDELNCKACGYKTCIEKAIGVLEKKADPNLCLPFALSKAQSMSHVVLEYTPNGILVVDDENKIVEINPAACKHLKTTAHYAKHKSIFRFLDGEILKQTLSNLHEVTYFIEDYPALNKTFDHACILIEKTPYTIIILMDLTQKIAKEKQLKEYRNQIVNVTQKIIDEQMITVQEIAGLLGESSAKSKVALENLKNTLKDGLL